MNLDEPHRFAEVDPLDALGDVEGTAAQWLQAQTYAGSPVDLRGLDAVLMAGMGGSGITGDLVAALAADQLDLPIVVQKGYRLPRWAGRRTLVVAVSYSGQTEETLSVVAEAIVRGCRVLAVASGGDLDRIADEHGLDRVTVPGGGMPRHSLGKLAVPALVALGLDEGLDEVTAVQLRLTAACGRDVPTDANPAKRLAVTIASGGRVAAYGGAGLPAVAARRLKCQLNENAKLPAFFAVVPELCHNEIVGWEGGTPLAGDGIVWLRDPTGEHPQVGRRITVMDRLIAERVAWTAEVTASGHTPVARLASLLLMADLVSVYTAIVLDRDPTPITSIDTLKRELAQQCP
ncbi:MAG: bifunctional phosphoglucose/phosphomannose isomerase [Egibacteraceae bacterium]